MKRICAILIIWCSIVASAQVKITVPEPQYKSFDQIDVEIMNTGTSDVTFCVEYGYASPIDWDHTEPTPTPVYVQQKTSRGWGVLLTGPDIGNMVIPVTLGRGESQHFPFRVNMHGTVRLVLDYWIGSTAPCEHRKGMKSVKSRQFSID